jgi:hypothetical protein
MPFSQKNKIYIWVINFFSQIKNRAVLNAFSLNMRKAISICAFLRRENISLAGVDIHRKYRLWISEKNNKVITKLKFSNTEQVCSSFPKAKMI